MGIPPRVESVLICEWVHYPMTGNRPTLFGLFNALRFPEFPVTLPGCWVFMTLTDLRGPTPIHAQIVRVVDDLTGETAVIVRGEPHVIVAPDPLYVAEGAVQFDDLQFPVSGEYRAEIVWNGKQVIASKRLRVRELLPDERSGPAV